ncbi:hypothetical protein KDU71_03800 [Carboxylicivirga sediminis]|uniref:SMODS and SLOG-associating 2TM effector domain-containing protein n=1 Tax=Carboxylicivirga sediminis TaxID=2006564 RepID=A0A941F0N3_9BACT|nr:hypothetical protein [Carboxylicivirga sediminis]MBR8534671.1 hypothetical protein [Carboxylicivirga sediminis]
MSNNNYSTKIFEDAYNIAQERQAEFSKESRIRLFFAYTFKAIAVLGGIILTTGVNEKAAQIIGISISVVIAIDLIFSNHKRLLIITKAAKGLELFIQDVHFQYNKSIQEVLNNRDSGNDTEAKNILDEINNKFASKCHEKSQEIIKAVDEADLKFLENLVVEKKEDK